MYSHTPQGWVRWLKCTATYRKARELADIIGLAGLAALVKVRGGTTVKIPVNRENLESSWLTDVLDIDQLDALHSHYKGLALPIPNLAGAKRKLIHHEIRQRRRSGQPVAEVAAALGVNERTVYRYQSSTPLDGEQLETLGRLATQDDGSPP